MARLTGIGGVFFKAQDPKALADWYRDKVGLEIGEDGSVVFAWSDDPQKGGTGHTIWGPFDSTTCYFDPSEKPFMINFRVDDLDAMLTQLRDAGVTVMDAEDHAPYGRFGWFMDPEGNKIELWEPPDTAPIS